MSGPEWGSGIDSDGLDPCDPWDYDDYYRSESQHDSSSDSVEEYPDASLKKSGEQPVLKRLLPLEELCCRYVGQNLPFGIVQLYPSRLPEDLQRRIAFWSFPTEEKELLANARHLGGASKGEIQSARRAQVENMVQSGEIDLWIDCYC